MFSLKRTRDGFSVLRIGNLNLNASVGIIKDRYLAVTLGHVNVFDTVYMADLNFVYASLFLWHTPDVFEAYFSCRSARCLR